MKLRREKNGDLVIRVGAREALFLRELAAELRAHVENPDFTGRIAQRLFPRYAEDDKVNEELRQMLHEEQRRQKLDRAGAFASALERLPPAGGELRLPPADVELWLALLTDLRLMYAAVIGIEDDTWGGDLDPGRPPSREVAVYLHLTDLQQALLDQAFGIGFKRDWSRPR